MDREIVLTQDAHKAAEWDPVDRVFGLAAPDAGYPRWEPERELQDLHAQGASRGEVAELVDRDDEREHHDEDHGRLDAAEDREDAGHARASAGCSSRRTRASIRMISSSAGAVPPPAATSVPRRRSPTMSVNLISPARNRVTATSSAAERPTIAPWSPARAVART